MKSSKNKEVPECKECGRTMDFWKSWEVYYCRNCSIVYDPEKDSYWESRE